MYIALTLADVERNGLIAPIVRYVGDGLAHRAIAIGSTCTGERGMGQKKIAFMEDEHGLPARDLMRRIKVAFDPQNLFNPGKDYPGVRRPRCRRGQNCSMGNASPV